jgi:GDPmannose 4,6-dehydratase
MTKIAIITGSGGQAAFWLTKLLLSKDYTVIGVKRRKATPTVGDLRIARLASMFPNKLIIRDGDITDLSSILRLVQEYQPNEFFHLSAQSQVHKSWIMPATTEAINSGGTYNCLEAVRVGKKDCKFFFAASSEMYGNASDGTTLIDEDTSFNPLSPYAATKVYGYNLCNVYRDSYDMFICSNIMFNYESEIRGEEFVTRKITAGLARIKHGQQKKIQLGNMLSKRDWGYAPEVMEAAWLTMQQSNPQNFVIATGKTHSVQEFFDLSCKFFRLNPADVLEINSNFVRPNELNTLVGNSRRAQRVLNWKPQLPFKDLVRRMSNYDFYLQNPMPAIAKAADDVLFEGINNGIE